MGGVIYGFEDIGSDLPRPPMAAMRALLTAGVVLSPRGWNALSYEARQLFVVAGSQPIVDAIGVQASLRNSAVSEVRLVPRTLDPNPNEVPEALVTALTPHTHISNTSWAALRPIDRFVLATLALNARLLYRAVQEILPDIESEPGKVTVAHVEVTMQPEALERLCSPTFLDGRAFMLARVAGVRAARRAQETFDLRSELATGTIELDWAPGETPGKAVWQAHVSSWDGAFFAAATLVAASTAAVALADMIAEDDPSVSIDGARIVKERWVVGAGSNESATMVVAAGARAIPPATIMTGPPQGMMTPERPPVQTLASAANFSRPPSLAHAPHAPSTAPRMAIPIVQPPARNSVLLWGVFGLLAAILIALVGIFFAVTSVHR